MQLFMIRHGQTEWNRQRRVMGTGPVPLNEQGREMVRILARALEREGIRAIYTSTVERARETAGILADAWDAEVRDEPRLNEASFERWIGRTYGELKGDPDFELYTTMPTRSNFSEHEGLAEVQRRVVESVERIRAECPGRKAAAVSHSDVIKPLIAHHLGMDLDDIHRLAVANASLTLFDYRDDGKVRVRLINYAPWKWTG